MSALAIAAVVHPDIAAIKRLRSEAAAVRALLDEMERIVPASLDEGALSAQLVESLARLGCRFLESAASLALVVEPESSTAA